MPNSNDGIALEAGNTVIAAVREAYDRDVATLTVVVDRAALPGDGPPAMPATKYGQERRQALLPRQR